MRGTHEVAVMKEVEKTWEMKVEGVKEVAMVVGSGGGLLVGKEKVEEQKEG